MNESSPRDKRAAPARGLTKLGQLSPAFISEDDAARYIHERIGTRRDVEYASVILRRLSDDLYVASEPVAGEPTKFNWNRLLDRERADGEFMNPEGYQIVASLHSHPGSLDWVKKTYPTWTLQQMKAFMSFYSTPDILINHQDRARFTQAYLSGPDGTLMRYQPSDSPAEAGFVHWLDTNGPWSSPHAHDGTVEGVYKKLASVGRLTFVQSSPDWGGSTGDVPVDWQPYQPFVAPPMPLSCGPVYASVEEALSYARSRVQRNPNTRQRVLLLKHDLKNVFVAAQPELTGVDSKQLPLFPAGLNLHGLYFHARPLPSQYPDREPWLYKSFISPMELAIHIAQFRQYSQGAQSTLGASLYIRMRDESILRYQFSGSAAETALFSRTTTGDVSDNGIQAALQSGALLTRALVLQVAAAGELTVVKASNIWDTVGLVTPGWRPFSKIPVPAVSPAFIQADDAARWAHEAIGERRDVEYGGVILKRANRYYATHPVPDQRNSFDHGILLGKDSEGNFIAPDDYTAEAFYHSHPADAAQIQRMFPSFTADQVVLFNNFYSMPDQLFSFKNRAFAKAHYFSGPDNVLLKYVSSGSAAENTFAQQVRDGTVEAKSDFENPIWNLAQIGELWVLIAHRVWGGVYGRVKKGWRINTPVTTSSAVQQQPFFTPVFPTADTAVMGALLSPGAAGAGAMGFVLKHTSEDAYVATLALPKRQPVFSPNNVFPERTGGKLRLPSNYRLEAIYFNSWYEKDEIAALEQWLASTFFTPAQIVAATRQARATLDIQNPVRGLSLYMQASDGALLKLKVPEATPTSELVRPQREGELDDNGAQAALVAGTLSPRDYVRRVVAATELSVVKAAGLWRTVGRVDNSANLLKTPYKAVLSRSFLSARDAAVYAHEQIGNWRSRTYGGYILKGEDGRFVITEPMASFDNPFAFTLFFPRDGRGPLIPPEPYVLHGRYGSHTALSTVDPAWVAQRKWTLDEAQLNLQVFADDEMYSVITAGRVAYLSGAQDCLLEYTPSNSPQEQLLLANIGPLAGGDSLGKRLDDGRIRPADWVRRLAEAGDFRIIQGNPLWGQRSVVYNDWSPNYVYAPKFGPPDYSTYGALFDSADEAARNLHGRVHGRHFPEQAYFAFILKHKDKEQYIASEVVGVAAWHSLFDLDSVFERADENTYRLPDGFVLHGLFRSQQWSPAGLNASNAWLTLYFVTPGVLYASLHAANRNGRNPLSIYFSTLDGALLRYLTAPADMRSSGLADRLLILAQDQLNSGQKNPVDFVKEWAVKGQLQVIRTSQCWDKTGSVDKTWVGYATLAPRRLSPSFANRDDAARYASGMVNNGWRRAYGGVILRLPNGLYASTEPLALPPQGFALNWIYPDQVIAAGLYPGGSTIIARYRSLLDQEVSLLLSATQKALYQTMPPSTVLSELFHGQSPIKQEYVFGSNGSILSYKMSDSAEESLFKNRLVPLNAIKGDYGDNSVEQQMRSGALSPQAFIIEAAKAGELRVVKGDSVWGEPRTITAGFVAYQTQLNPGEIRHVFGDAPCSPIFTQAYDAVRYAQRMWTPQTDVAFGYVLKSVNKPLYMATLALVRENLADLKQVFVDGQLPQGYVLDGLYLCGSTAAVASADDEMAHSFFPPSYIAKALQFTRYARNGSVVPLYLLCSDGALLKYVFPKTSPLFDWTNKAHLDHTQLLQGTLKVREYVRRLAGVGELYIRGTSEVWGRKERVTDVWLPKKAPHVFAFDPHLHSFCGPLFFYPDDAARYAQGLVAPYRGKQYLGAVLVPGPTPGYVAIEPVEEQGTGTTSTLALLFWIDHAGFDVPSYNVLGTYKIAAVQAFYKAIPSTSSFEQIDKDLLGNFVSKDDLRDYLAQVKSNAPDAMSCYLSCRGGALLKYVPAFTAAETRLLEPGQAPDPSVLVSQLRNLGSLSVLVPDAFWRRPGLLGEEWKAGDLQGEMDVDGFWYARDKDEL